MGSSDGKLDALLLCLPMQDGDEMAEMADSPEGELPPDVARELWNRREEMLRLTAQLVAASLSKPGFELPESGSEELQEWVAQHAEVAEAIIGYADTGFDASVQAELGGVLEGDSGDGMDGLP